MPQAANVGENLVQAAAQVMIVAGTAILDDMPIRPVDLLCIHVQGIDMYVSAFVWEGTEQLPDLLQQFSVRKNRLLLNHV